MIYVTSCDSVVAVPVQNFIVSLANPVAKVLAGTSGLFCKGYYGGRNDAFFYS